MALCLFPVGPSQPLARHAAADPGHQAPKPLLCVRGHAASASPQTGCKVPRPRVGTSRAVRTGGSLTPALSALERLLVVQAKGPHLAILPTVAPAEQLRPVPGAKHREPRFWEGPRHPSTSTVWLFRSSSWPLSALPSFPLSCPRAMSASSLSSNAPVPLHRLLSLPGTQPPHTPPRSCRAWHLSSFRRSPQGHRVGKFSPDPSTHRHRPRVPRLCPRPVFTLPFIYCLRLLLSACPCQNASSRPAGSLLFPLSADMSPRKVPDSE